jgi:hypothetical protein
LFTVPDGVTMSMQSRTPRFHGMSQHRLMYIDDSTAAWRPEYVELIRPRAFGLVPVKSNVNLSPRFVSVQTTLVDLRFVAVVVDVLGFAPLTVRQLAQAQRQLFGRVRDHAVHRRP